jgi:hypothetical protein
MGIQFFKRWIPACAGMTEYLPATTPQKKLTALDRL